MESLYRVQNEQGIGPYWAEDKSGRIQDLLYAHNNSAEIHPDPGQDGYSIRDDNEFCAFSTMEQLNDWFTPDEFAMLQEEDFEIIELGPDQVEIVVELSKQTIFKYKETG